MSGTEKSSWLSRLRAGLQSSSAKLTGGIAEVFVRQKLDEQTLAALEDSLVAADLGPLTAKRLVDEFAQNRFGKDVTDQEVKEVLAKQIADILRPCAVPLKIPLGRMPVMEDCLQQEQRNSSPLPPTPEASADFVPRPAVALAKAGEGEVRWGVGKTRTDPPTAKTNELLRNSKFSLLPPQGGKKDSVSSGLDLVPSLHDAPKPFVILVVGVNGTGKTTTIGKLAKHYRDAGLKVILAAGDTFRAAAVSQLKIWGERTSVPVIAGPEGGDSASVAFEALEKARAQQADVLLIDTAGRLHNKNDLMQELAKLARVIKKLDAEAPHATLLVLDATTGQNAHNQVEVFKELTNITGLVVTKLDGSAKGGVLVALADHFRLPIHAIGVGEGADDLQAFDADDFARALVGLGD